MHGAQYDLQSDFAIVDFFTYRQHVELFLIYRLSLVLILAAFVLILRSKPTHSITLLLTFTGYLLGGLTLTLMIITVDGFASSYYVGLLLIAVGGFSLLPITVFQAAFSGFALFLMYTSLIFVFSKSEKDNTVLLKTSHRDKAVVIEGEHAGRFIPLQNYLKLEEENCQLINQINELEIKIGTNYEN